MGVYPSRWEQVSTLPPLQIQIDDALRVRQLELHHLHRPVLVGPLDKASVGRFVGGKGTLPARGLGLEEECLEDSLGCDFVVQVIVREDLPEFPAGHVGESHEAPQPGPQDLPPLLQVGVMSTGPLEHKVIDRILGCNLEVVTGKDCLDANKRKIQEFILRPENNREKKKKKKD